MFRFATLVAAATALGIFASTAEAASLNFGPKSAGGRGPVITFTNLIAPTTLTGDATFTFTVQGDLDWYSEYVDVSMDGFSLGRVFDNNTSNDPFNVPSDRGSYRAMTTSATISNGDFAPLIADGRLNLVFNFSRKVDFAGTVKTLYGNVSYNSTIITSSSDTAPAPVPLPAGMPLIAGGLGTLALMRRKKNRS